MMGLRMDMAEMLLYGRVFGAIAGNPATGSGGPLTLTSQARGVTLGAGHACAPQPVRLQHMLVSMVTYRLVALARGVREVLEGLTRPTHST